MLFYVRQRLPMSVFSLYDQYGSGIRDLFSSAVSIKILLLLLGTHRSIPEICAESGHVHGAVLAKVRRLEEYGMIAHESETFTLTTLGTVLAAKILPLYTGRDMGADEKTLAAAVPDTPAADEGQKDGLCQLPAFPHVPDIRGHYERQSKSINLVFRSGIRTKMLLALDTGATDRDVLRDVTGCGTSHFRTNLRHLIDAGLIREGRDGISLTPRGEDITSSIHQIVPLAALIVRHREFWQNHDLRNLPWFALESLGALAESEIIHDDGKEFFRTYEHYLGIIASARHIHGITGMANPGIADAITRRVMEGFPGEIIVTPELARHLYDEQYRDKVHHISAIPHFRFLVTERPIPPCMTVTNAYLSMKMFLTGSDTYDFMNGFVSTAPEALAWAERVYAYYRKSAVSIAEYLGEHPVEP